MPSEHFSGHTLTKVKNYLKKGVDKPFMFRDMDTSGLAIKVTSSGASWYLSTRSINRQLADFSSFGLNDLPSLRALVVQLKQELDKGRDVVPMIKAFASGHSVTDAKNLHDVEHGDGLTWELGRDQFLEWAARNLNKDTARGYRSALGASKGLADDFRPLHGKPLASITLHDLACVRDNIVHRCREERGDGHGIRQANLTVAALKSAFRYFRNVSSIFVPTNPTIELSKALERSDVSAKPGLRPLTQLELGALWSALLSCRNEQVRLVLQLQLLTGQRRYTATSALKAAFQSDGPYEMIWGMEDKVHHWRKLPLPPVAASVVKQALRLTRDDNRYLFPQQRPRKAGSGVDHHVNERTVSSKIEEMGRPGGVFEKLPFSVSTHDMRKAFTTIVGPKLSMFELHGRQLSPDEIVMITHLNEGRETVSQKVYDRNVNLDVKLEILTWWQDYVMDGYRMYLAELEQKQAA